jgi:RHS repeat-associated protein
LSGGSIPLNMNDATTTGSSSTTSSYLYGNVLFGGTAPVEQISGSTAVFLVTSPTGVQGVYGATGTSLEQALYSPYGSPTITSGAIVTPFGFQGSYTDATGMIFLINRYYDPTTDQFLSIDPLVDQTNQPYVFVNDNPLNSTDPLGLWPNWLAITSAIAAPITHIVSFAWQHRTTIAGALAAATCVALSVGACAFAVVVALVVRVQYRVEKQGSANSLGSNISDAVITAGTFGPVRLPLAQADLGSFSVGQQVMVRAVTGAPSVVNAFWHSESNTRNRRLR